LSGFTDDIVVEFADLPRIKGKAELERILKARLARQKGYRLEKTLRAVAGATIVGSWTADWVDATTDEVQARSQYPHSAVLQRREGNPSMCRF